MEINKEQEKKYVKINKTNLIFQKIKVLLLTKQFLT